MKNNLKSNIFCATNALKALSFLIDNPGKEFLGSEIQKATSLSRAGVYIALKELIQERLVLKLKKGKFLLYAIRHNDPINKQFKILRNILFLRTLVFKIIPFSKKIVLFGSVARGEDSQNSDIDLFVLAKDTQLVRDIISSLKLKRKMQAVVKTASEFSDFKEKEKVFCNEIDRGIVLWEEKK